jgi:hypothetical protein
MKTSLSILCFITSWFIINLLLAAGISLVFNIPYTDVVQSVPFIAMVSVISSPIVAGSIAVEVYEKLEQRES